MQKSLTVSYRSRFQLILAILTAEPSYVSSFFMFTRDQFRQVKCLKHFLESKSLHYQWLFIPKGIDLTLDTLCLGVREDFEEFEDFAEELKDGGMREFLSTTQLEDIVENLRLQKSSFTDSELLSAVKFYFHNDEF